MLKEMNHTLPQAGQVGIKNPASAASSEQMLMKLLGQGKLGAEEQSLLDLSQGEKNFSELLALGSSSKEGQAAELALINPKAQTLENLSVHNVLSQQKPTIQLQNSGELDLVSTLKNKKSEKAFEANQTLGQILGGKKNQVEAGGELPAERSLFLNDEAKLKSTLKGTEEGLITKKMSNHSSSPMNAEASGLEISSPAMSKVSQKTAIKQFAKEQNNLSGNLLKFKRDAGEEEKNKVDMKMEQTKSEWVEQMSQKSEPKLASATALNGKGDVLDLSSIQASNRAELMSKISSYIEQNAVRSENGLDLKIKHDDLGDIKIKVQKGAKGDVNLNMIADSVETTKFLRANESELLSNLNQSGIKLGDFKIVTNSEFMPKLDQSTDFNMNRDSKGQADSQNRFSQGQNDQGREKRRELWERMKDQRAA